MVKVLTAELQGKKWTHNTTSVFSRDRLVVRTLRCGRSNPGSNPGHGMDNFFQKIFQNIFKKGPASAGNRTRINCLEGSYADHYTTDALMRYSMKFSQHTKIIIKIGYVIITFSIAFAAI